LPSAWGPITPCPLWEREKGATILIVDTHCHALPHWFEPVEVLLHQMHANGVEKALLVQVRGQFDNRYLIECVRRFRDDFPRLRRERDGASRWDICAAH
jgi:hypothetical protein